MGWFKHVGRVKGDNTVGGSGWGTAPANQWEERSPGWGMLERSVWGVCGEASNEAYSYNFRKARKLRGSSHKLSPSPLTVCTSPWPPDKSHVRCVWISLMCGTFPFPDHMTSRSKLIQTIPFLTNDFKVVLFWHIFCLRFMAFEPNLYQFPRFSGLWNGNPCFIDKKSKQLYPIQTSCKC